MTTEPTQLAAFIYSLLLLYYYLTKMLNFDGKPPIDCLHLINVFAANKKLFLISPASNKYRDYISLSVYSAIVYKHAAALKREISCPKMLAIHSFNTVRKKSMRPLRRWVFLCLIPQTQML